MSGLELMRLATKRDSDLAVIMLAGTNHAATATAALTGGAIDYLVKPVEFAELRDAIRGALHVRSLHIQH